MSASAEIYSPALPLKGRVIIVGATTGIGRATAQLLVNKGYAVGISGRTLAALTSFEAENKGKPVITRQFDVTQPGITAHLDAMVTALGGLDILVYCSGGGDVNPSLDQEFEMQMYHTNATGFITLAAHAFRFFSQRGSGHLVGISSLAANRGLQASPAYSASKAMMSNYLEGLWIRSKKEKLNIAVTDIQPGFVDTSGKRPGSFWWVPLPKAARQIVAAIEGKRKRAYISRRWAPVAWFMRQAPNWLLVKAT